MTARERITEVVEKWFLVEPLLFAVWTTHELAVNPRIGTIRVRQGRVEYNPAFIDALDRQQLEQVLAQVQWLQGQIGPFFAVTSYLPTRVFLKPL
jgi:hypothetical protein